MALVKELSEDLSTMFPAGYIEMLLHSLGYIWEAETLFHDCMIL